MNTDAGSALTGERSDSKVAAIFPSEAQARAVSTAIRDESALQPEQVMVVTPHDRHPGRKMQPESRGILRTIIVSHYKLAIAGIVLGLLVFAALLLMGVDAVARSPGLAAFALVFFGACFGMFAGGLVSLRPDQDAYVLKIREALTEGRSAVVVHAFNTDERQRAEAALAHHGGQTISSL